MPYNPNQPRDPGGKNGGQWIKAAGRLPHGQHPGRDPHFAAHNGPPGIQGVNLSKLKPRKADSSLLKKPTSSELKKVGTRVPKALQRGDVIRVGSGHARVIRVTMHEDPRFMQVGYRYGPNSWQVGSITARLNDRL